MTPWFENSVEVVAISDQTTIRVRPSHRTLMGVITSEGGFRTNTGAIEVAVRLMAEAMIVDSLARSRPGGAQVEILLAGLNAAAQETHQVSTPWYRIDGGRLQRWSITRQAYEEIMAPADLPQAAIRRRN